MGRIKNVMRIRLGLTAVVVVAATALAAGISAAPARADANNTIGFDNLRGTFSIYTSSVGGSGNQINYVNAGFTYIGQICNLWIDHNFYDASGTLVYHIQGPEKYGCFSVAAQGWTWGSSWYSAPEYGKHCATLYSQEPGYIRTWVTACNNIG